MRTAETAPSTPEGLARWVEATRGRTLDLLADLADEELLVPRLEIVNPFLWELGHVAWFQERWALREAAGEAPAHAAGDDWWDSSEVAHDSRWHLDLPSREETGRYAAEVAERVLARLGAGELDERMRELVLLSVFHEDMHAEAFTYMRQTLGLAAPAAVRERASTRRPEVEDGGADGDVRIPGGVFRLGTAPHRGLDAPFVFDNERWAHEVELAPFAIARRAVTQGELAAFVEDGGYARRELWSDAGWAWRSEVGAEHPVYWRRAGDGWRRRRFDEWVPLEPDLPASHVSWHEAEAWCRCAGRRLPTEAEWERAASLGEDTGGEKRRFPWGEDPDAERANLDVRSGDAVDVRALAAGDAPLGLRQMLGNVWEWTASTFEPFPGFEPGHYRDYSAPWFGTRKVLRGGSWMTPARLVHTGYRNFFTPDRRDVASGFRTCAL
jgi:iron(II)-dependent oxidoreductase